MNLRPAGLLVVMAALAWTSASSAQELARDEVAPPPPRRPLFTAAQMERFRAIAAAQEARRESYIRASENDDIIVLEPYIVEGDSSLVLARIRRELDRGAGGTTRIFVGLSEATYHDLALARRREDAFFRPNTLGRPADAPAFEGIDLVKLPGKLRRENLRELFRKPPE